MATSVKAEVLRLVQFFQDNKIAVESAAIGATQVKLTISGDYDKLPAYVKARCRGFPDGEKFYVFVRKRDIEVVLRGPPQRRGRIERVKIGGKIVESELVSVRVPGIAFDGQFTLENDGGAGTVPYGDSARSPYRPPKG